MPDNPAMEEPGHFFAPLIEHVIIWEDSDDKGPAPINTPIEATPEDMHPHPAQHPEEYQPSEWHDTLALAEGPQVDAHHIEAMPADHSADHSAGHSADTSSSHDPSTEA
ncbi:MAG: hypothetical protein M3081_07645 [Gemmatimonadota bacterium]|nr:hypothetical protein [Gemmatimonadota bacterium]